MEFNAVTVEELRKIFVALRDKVGCQDHGCMFRKPPGAATNGGKCYCVGRRPFVLPGLGMLYRLVAELLEENP